MSLPPTVPLSRDLVAGLPKVLLHEHLDGGLRPATLIRLADEVGYQGLPTREPVWLAEAMYAGGAGDLERYLGLFAHTVAVMQTPTALERVAAESAADLAADGVVYAEVRFAPLLHRRRGLSAEEAVAAVLAGFERGARRHGIELRLLLTAMRTDPGADDVAALAAAFRDRGVVGIDLAGAEEGHPASAHLTAFDHALAADLGVTIHAGEAAGLASIEDALDCGAQRLGHGMRLADDLDGERLGPLATRVRDAGVTLEVCPTSNVHSGGVASLAAHPVDRLRRAGLPVTVNTDNRLMSGITLTDELWQCVTTFGWDLAVLEAVTTTAIDAAFCGDAVRERLRRDVLEPGFDAVRRAAAVSDPR